MLRALITFSIPIIALVSLFAWIYFLYIRRGLSIAVLLPGATLSLIRVSFVARGSYLLYETADDRQILGYIMLMFTLPETLLVSGLRNQVLLWANVASVLVVLGSFLCVLVLASLASLVSKWRVRSDT